MPAIITGFETLSKYCEYRKSIQNSSTALCQPSDKIDCCVYCDALNPSPHGHYERKPDRENDGENSLNPVIILRFLCKQCHRTFSALPECLPPRRWYPWETQEQVLKLAIAGNSINTTNKQVKPCRDTINRWLSRFETLRCDYKEHWLSWYNESKLGYVVNTFVEFWQTLLQKNSLAKSMCYLHDRGVAIP